MTRRKQLYAAGHLQFKINPRKATARIQFTRSFCSVSFCFCLTIPVMHIQFFNIISFALLLIFANLIQAHSRIEGIRQQERDNKHVVRIVLILSFY